MPEENQEPRSQISGYPHRDLNPQETYLHCRKYPRRPTSQIWNILYKTY